MTMVMASRMRMGVGVAALTFFGCGDDGSGNGGSAAGGAGQGGSGGSAGDPYAAMYECEETNFTEVKPLSGPGYDPATGFVGEPQATYIAATTQIYVATDKQDAFLSANGPVFSQIANAPGLVAYTVGGDADCQVNRTMTIWESEDAMYAFVTSDAHAVVMGQVTELSLTGKTTHWTTTPEEIEAQTWDTARAKLSEEDPSELYD